MQLRLNNPVPSDGSAGDEKEEKNGEDGTAAKKKHGHGVSSAPPVPSRAVTSDIQLTIHNCINRSNSCVGSKYKGVITSERLGQLKKMVENAATNGKIFTIRGNWNVIRQQLVKREWMEKVEVPEKDKTNMCARIRGISSTASDELMGNLPLKQDWESPSAYAEKCEKLITARLLQRIEANFFWSVKRDQFDQKQRANPNRLLNRFSRSLFASKEGLALLLQNYYWFTEPDVATVNFPRCFVLGFPEHFNHFVDNFRMTAAISLLKYVVHTYDTTKFKYSVEMSDGKIPISSLKFAIDRCLEYIASQKHLDIDRDFARVTQQEWNNFINDYYSIVHNGEKFKTLPDTPILTIVSQAKTILKDVAKYWTEFETDGFRNIWILKPGNKCRGRGIILVKYLKEVEKIMNLKLKYVVQKYIERPLIIYNTKFDIRQWFLVTNAQPLTIWMYKECYLRFSSQNYNLENFHESLHLTNYAVQCKYTNMEQRDKSLPKDNMWDSPTFRDYLRRLGKGDKWEQVVYPGMKESIVCAMLASQDTMDRRQNTFEMYGADFILGEDLRPWLLEINCSPDMSSSTSITKRMCPQFLSDIIKVVIDRRKDPKADVGNFELVYKQVLPRAPPYLGTNLAIRGKRMLRNRALRIKLSSRNEKEKENTFQKKQSLLRAELLRKTTVLQKLPKIVTQDVYKGPVIEDLIEELQKCCQSLSDEKFEEQTVKTSNANGVLAEVMLAKNKLTNNSRFNRKVPEKERRKKWIPVKSKLCKKTSNRESKSTTNMLTLPINIWEPNTAIVVGKG
ncbi:tubulin glycylase 3A-like isoform X2 [Coccinella septempunctata]|uniref:tubulin glycylase 3A-like isoform X2 n=1 Tax=Coccinella septempunctata TaxID=41139 RepID=UPI001D06570E|nr:tubulin glycylase 3A-like isoform X2 [Coccinella septempunctata]